MFRKLSLDLHLHVFSFFSSSDIQNNETINKDTKKLASNPLVWKNLLKNEFFLPESNKIKNPRLTYQELNDKESIERDHLYNNLIFVLFSQEIKKQMLEVKFEDPEEHPIPEEYREEVNEFYHRDRIYVFDSKFYTLFDLDFHQFKERLPPVDENKIRLQVKNYMNAFFKFTLDDKNPIVHEILLVLAKYDLPITMRVVLNKLKLNQPLLDRLLHEASDLLNISSAKLLIEFGADVNAYLVDRYSFGLSQSACLYKAVCTYQLTKKHFSFEKAEQFIKFLLTNSADPDGLCFKLWQDQQEYPRKSNVTIEEFEKGKFTLRECCIQFKENILENPDIIPDASDMNLVKILDLIISAPKLTFSEPAQKKMRI